MAHGSLAGWTRGRLRLWLGLFFVALAVPTALLVRHAYGQLKWETFRQYQLLAEELGARIDGRFIELVNREEARGFADYGFLVVEGDPPASFLQRSPLSVFPVSSDIPGLIGYFQVDAEGVLSSPLMPAGGTDAARYGVGGEELRQREALAERLRLILGENRLVQAGEDVSIRSRQDERRRDPGPVEAPESVSSRGGGAPPAHDAQAMPQAAFDQLNEAVRAPAKKKQEAPTSLGRIEDLGLDYRYQKQAESAPESKAADAPQRQILADNLARLEKRGARKEIEALPEAQTPAAPAVAEEAPRETGAAAGSAFAGVAEPKMAPQFAGRTLERDEPEPRVLMFESEIDTFDAALLDSGQFVLFRKVWREGRRFIQGLLIEQQPLLRGVIESALRETALASMSDLVVAWQGRVLSLFSGQAGRDYLSSTETLDGSVLHQTRLSSPFGDMELVFSVNTLPVGPGGRVIHWLSAILALVLSGGFYLMYRLGLRQIELARQQQDFVSAVSHELKTPLTSIRMYGEMLREGWAPEDKKRAYYDYIHDESERLSRLIANVLQLARMTRNDLKLELRSVTAGELMDGVRSKVASQIERAGFALNLECPDEVAGAKLEADPDAFSQILINLVDNAIKFSAKADRRTVDIACRRERDTLVFSVRDHGPGVPRDQMKKIFRLFYRAQSELTRETLGTGIGLALVSQLARAMGGTVDIVNRDPGAEFRVSFPVAT